MKTLLLALALLSLSACKAPPKKEALCMSVVGPIQVQEDENTKIDVSRFGIVSISRGPESIKLSLSNCLVQEKAAE